MGAVSTGDLKDADKLFSEPAFVVVVHRVAGARVWELRRRREQPEHLLRSQRQSSIRSLACSGDSRDGTDDVEIRGLIRTVCCIQLAATPA